MDHVMQVRVGSLEEFVGYLPGARGAELARRLAIVLDHRERIAHLGDASPTQSAGSGARGLQRSVTRGHIGWRLQIPESDLFEKGRAFHGEHRASRKIAE